MLRKLEIIAALGLRDLDLSRHHAVRHRTHAIKNLFSVCLNLFSLLSYFNASYTILEWVIVLLY